MTYELHEEYSCDFTGGPMDPKGFAIHWWGNPPLSFWPIVNVLLTRSEQRSASVNFVAEAGLVACLVDPFTVAWAQGDGATGWGNLNLVSIECNPRCSAGDRETVAELIADQHIRNGIPIRLYPHKAFTATQCPGVWEQHIPWLTERANQIVAAKTSPAPAPAPAPAPPPPPPAPKPEEDKMLVIAKLEKDDRIWIGDGVTRRHISDPVLLQHYRNVHTALKIWDGGKTQVWGSVDVLGLDIAGHITDRIAQMKPAEIAGLIPDALAAAVADHLAKRLAS